MKKIIFLGLIFSLIIGSCSNQKEVKSPNEGAWKVVSWEHFTGGNLDWKLQGKMTGSEIKIASKNHFVWVGRYKNDTTFMDNYGGGTFKLDGNRLEESILYSVDQSMVGTKIKLLWELRNDTAIQKWPCDDNWQLNKDTYGIQKLVKVE
jgi:hypothetical protein